MSSQDAYAAPPPSTAPPQSAPPPPPPASAPPPPPAHTEESTHDVLLVLIAIFVPPVSVYFKRKCHADLWINIGLCILGWFPGVFHAWWIISKY